MKAICRVIQFAVLMAVTLIAGGSALAQDVNYNFTPGTDFSKFKTDKWVEIPGAQTVDQILDQQIEQSIDSQLAAKRFTKTVADTADLNVGYQVSITEQRQ